MKAARISETVFGIIFLAMSVSCTSSGANTASGFRHSDAEITVAEVEDSEPLLYASLLNHPHAFESGAVEVLMRSLHFSPKGIISWAEERPIFPEATIQAVAPRIREAFLQVKPFQKIQFEVQTPEGPSTSDLFILDGEFHWRFETIQGTTHFDEFVSPFQFGSETSIPPNWVLRPQDHQRYYAQELLLDIKRKAKNWLVIAMGEATEEKKEEPTLALRESLTERLRVLTELKASGLITMGDFEKKVQALLADAADEKIPATDRLLFLKQLQDGGFISGAEYERRKQEVLDQI